MSILSYVYEKVTGQPYLTTVSMAAQYGPPPAVEFAAELAAYTDAELLARGDEIVAALRRAKRAGGQVPGRRAGGQVRGRRPGLAPELAQFTDAELRAHGDEIVAALRRAGVVPPLAA